MRVLFIIKIKLLLIFPAKLLYFDITFERLERFIVCKYILYIVNIKFWICISVMY